MNEDKPIDPIVLKRMMMGDFSSAFSDKKETVKSNTKKRKVELDLHFEKLYPTKSSIQPNQKLKLQKEALYDFLVDAKRTGIVSAYIIVGKGEGVLRQAVNKILKEEGIRSSEVADPPYFGNAIKIKL